ncbi:MAG: hypothetical protein IOD12_17335 [Silvanigrellales bacterium]|nr:hypothetical protein [Silvanigrellales bacterium]
MSRTTRRGQRARRDQRNLEGEGGILSQHALPLVASVQAGLLALFLLCCLLVLVAWPPAREVKEKGLLAAAREQVKMTAEQLKTLTLPEFVAKVASRLRQEGVAVTLDEGGTRLVFNSADAHFDRGSAELREDTRKKFEAFSRALAWGMSCHVKPVSTSCGTQTLLACEKGYAPFSFRGLALVGHADAVPFRANPEGRSNETLSVERGLAAKDVVESCLQDAEVEFLPQGLGATLPRVSPGVDARNRRVEVRFLP